MQIIYFAERSNGLSYFASLGQKKTDATLNRLPSEPIDLENDVNDWVPGIFSFYLENNSQPIAPMPNKPLRWPEWINDWERICLKMESERHYD